MTVRGFFSFHYVKLNYRRQESKRIGERYRKTEDYHFTLEEIKHMADCADLEDKYVVVAGKSFGLRASDFKRLSRGDLEPYINREPPISIGSINTVKENVPAYPFIDIDAQHVIKDMLVWMTRDGRTAPTDKMFQPKERELTSALKRLADKAGINSGNKRISFHCLRKFLIDNLSRFMSESKWKQIVGKTIDEGAYVSSDSLREDYKRAMVETTFVKVLGQQEAQLQSQKDMLITIAKQMFGFTDDKIKTIFRSKKATTLQAEVNLLEEITKAQEQEKQKANGCTDGKNCQRVASEAELETLLTQGWHVVLCLPSGKIVVSNEYA